MWSTILSFFKDFTNHSKKTNRAVDFSCRPFPNIVKIDVVKRMKLRYTVGKKITTLTEIKRKLVIGNAD